MVATQSTLLSALFARRVAAQPQPQAPPDLPVAQQVPTREERMQAADDDVVEDVEADVTAGAVGAEEGGEPRAKRPTGLRGFLHPGAATAERRGATARRRHNLFAALMGRQATGRMPPCAQVTHPPPFLCHRQTRTRGFSRRK